MHGGTYDVTLIMPPMWNPAIPSTAPAYLSEALRQRGYSVQFLDYNVRLYRLCEKLGYAYLWDDTAFFLAWNHGKLDYLIHLLDLNEIQGGVIGLCTTQTNLSPCNALADRIREQFPRRKIIMGGHAVYFPENVQNVPLRAADAICKGDGEEVICEVLARGFGNIGDIAGLYLPEDRGWQLTRERPLNTDLDAVPWPRYAEIDFRQYDGRYLGLVGSRGCIGRCIFCTERVRSPGYRVRSANSQVDELEYLSAHFPVVHFPYYDAISNANYRILTEKCNEILRRGLNVNFSANLMIRDNMSDDLFPLMRSSGFSVAFIGIESGSAATLAAMRKRHTPDQAACFLRKCHDAGIRTEVNFIIGFPTETEEHFQETLDFVKTNRANIDNIISVNTFSLGPSDLWDMRDAFGIVVEDESDATRLWHTRDHPNTLDIRIRRMNLFLEMGQEFGLRGQYLICDDYNFKDRSLPDPEALLQAYAAHIGSTDPDRYAQAATAVQRIRLLLKLRPPTPIELLHKLGRSFRSRGLRQTIRRGWEWQQVRRKHRS